MKNNEKTKEMFKKVLVKYNKLYKNKKRKEMRKYDYFYGDFCFYCI